MRGVPAKPSVAEFNATRMLINTQYDLLMGLITC